MKTKYVIAEYETRSFSFLIFARDREQGASLMQKAWKTHCRRTGADPDFFVPDEINFLDVDSETAVVFMDGSEHTKQVMK